MWLLVGLGNPGAQYRHHRHNIGFMAAEAIARRHDFSGWKKKFQAEAAEGALEGEKAMLLRPQTFMNMSGEAVQAAAAFYRVPPGNIVVFYDELDLVPGKVRVRRAGGAGGHNGIRSIDACLGPDYWRVRMGIGHPGDRGMVTPHVLGNFSKEETEFWLEKLLEAVAVHAGLLVTGKQELFMTRMAESLPRAQEAEGE